MAIITAIHAQKRNPNRVNVDLDGEFAFGLSRVVAAWLKVGDTLSDEKIARLQAEDEHEAAVQAAIHFLSYRPRTEQEIIRKLSDKGFTESVVTAVVERLKQSQMIGDERFAQVWVENRTALRPRSHRLMVMELRQKGVSDETAQTALEDAPDDETLAYQAGLARMNRYASLDFQEFRKKMSAYLGRKGFSYGVVSGVINRLWKECRAVGERENGSDSFSSEIETIGKGI